MLISPRPGTNRQNLLQALRQVHTAVHNLRGGGAPDAQGRLAGYLEWATATVQQLSNQISAADFDQLVLTRSYDRLLSIAGTMTGGDIATQRVLNGLVSLELTQRTDAFEAAIKALQEQTERWSRPGVFVVADTSFYIEHEDKLEDADFRPLLKIWEDPVHLLVPIVIVDELDGLKKSRNNRWRPGYTLAVLDRVFASSTGPARLTPEDFSVLGSGGIPRGEVTIELVFDPPGHVRLPINDDEIIDRILAIQPLAGREVTLLTYDTGQSTRARAAGLRVNKLKSPAESEPAPTPGRAATAEREHSPRSNTCGCR
jgi:hypothetical protein